VNVKHILLRLALLAAAGGPTLTVAADSAEQEGKPPTGISCEVSRACVLQLGYGNVCEEGFCKSYIDRADLFTLLHFTQDEKPAPAPFKLYPAFLPAVGYNPALGFLLGALGTFGMYLGDPDDTTMSSANGLVLVTTNSQLVVQSAQTIMTAGNEWELQGDWRFLLFNQDTYGLGTGTPAVSSSFSIDGWGQTTPINGAQPMKFDLLRIHELVLKKISKDLYVGGGYHLDRYFGIDDESLDLSASSPVVTSAYAYNTLYGFDTSEYTVSGVSADVLYDSRDSTINSYRGLYAHFGVLGLPTWLGSSQSASQAVGEFRAYLGLSDNTPRDVLAFWAIAQGPMGGHLPYLALPAIGWDASSTTGRGYVQGRFRGPAEVYAEVELRFRIANNGFLGGTVFANAETFSRPAVNLPAYPSASQGSVDLFQYVKPAGGVGLRLLMNRESRTNIRVDFAWGVDSFTLYLGSGEAF